MRSRNFIGALSICAGLALGFKQGAPIYGVQADEDEGGKTRASLTKAEYKELTEEQIARAKPVRDETDARWTARIAHYDGKNRPAGRPATFAVTSDYVIIPFDDAVLVRNLSNGLFGLEALAFGGTIDQVVRTSDGLLMAYLLSTEPNDPSADILVCAGVSGRDIKRLRGHRIQPWRILFSPDGSRLISCSDDQSMRLWDVKKGRQVAVFPGYGYGGNGSDVRGEFVGFSPDGKWLATAYEGKVSLRDPRNGAEKVTWQPYDTPFPSIDAARFAHDSQSLFAFWAGCGNTKGRKSRFGNLNWVQKRHEISRGTILQSTELRLPTRSS
jgi:WD40 repeat protein